MELKHNDLLAMQQSSAIASAATSLSSSGVVIKDSQTTIGGNNHAHQSIDLAHHTARQMVEVISVMSQNIHNLSSSFQAMDQAVSSQAFPVGDEARGFSLND